MEQPNQINDLDSEFSSDPERVQGLLRDAMVALAEPRDLPTWNEVIYTIDLLGRGLVSLRSGNTRAATKALNHAAYGLECLGLDALGREVGRCSLAIGW